MRFIVFISFLLLLYFGYYELFGNKVSPLANDDLETVLKSDSEEGRKLRASFQQILPKVEDDPNAVTAGNPHVVMVQNEPQTMEVEDAINRFQSLINSKEEEALTFLRWSLFMSDMTENAKEELFNAAITSLPKDQAMMLSRDILTGRGEPNLFRRALSLYTQNMEPETQEAFVRDLWLQVRGEGQKEILMEHASSQGITLQQ